MLRLTESTPANVARHLHVALFVHAFYPDHFYGTESYTRSLARQFLALGHRVTVVSAKAHGEPVQESLIERYEVDGIPVVRIDCNCFPVASARDTFDLPTLQPIFEELLQDLSPDVVHVCHLSNHTAALPRAISALGIPAFATLTDFFHFCLTGSLETTDGVLCTGPSATRDNCMACGIQLKARETPTGLWRWLADPKVRPIAAKVAASVPAYLPRFLARDAQAVVERPAVLRDAMRPYRAAIAPTLFLKAAFEANDCPVPIELSRFGIEVNRRPKPMHNGSRLRVGFIGQLTPYKGLHLLLQALASLEPDTFTLEIWGADTQDPNYVQGLREMALSMPVKFCGTFAEDGAEAVLAEVDVLVLPSTWYENSPLTLLKALATHTPVIVSDVQGMTEFIADGANGFSFPRGDTAALAARLQQLIDDPTLRGRMSKAALYERTEREMALDVLDLYRRYGIS